MQKSSKEKWLKKGHDYEAQPGPVSGATCLVGKVEKMVSFICETSDYMEASQPTSTIPAS